jgi:RNA polymerase sigma factor (sigma-70 family)
MAKHSQTDSQLVRMASSGDHQAFVTLVERHQAMVSGVALSILQDFGASEDAAQDTFVTAWKKIGTLHDPAKLRPWLATLARNTALSHLRMKKRKEANKALDETAKDFTPGPDQLSAHKDDLSLVLATLETLPEKYRTPLILFYREEQSVAAVAQALGLSQDAVKQRLKRGRDELRHQVESTLAKTLIRTAPSAAFTASVAGSITAFAPPTATAGTGFSISSVTSPTASASSTVATGALMKSHLSLTAAAMIGLAAIPAGYGMRSILTTESSPDRKKVKIAASFTANSFTRASIAIPPSEVVKEWKRLQEQYGSEAEAMPQLYEHIDGLESGFAKEALFSILIAEWVEADSQSGFDYLRLQNNNDRKTAFVEEWLRQDSEDAIESIRASGGAWARDLGEAATLLARTEPQFFFEHFDAISLHAWSNNNDDEALRILAEYDYLALRDAAISARKLRGADTYEIALGSALHKWGTLDGAGAVKWALNYEGEGSDYAQAGAFAGWASANPRAALDQFAETVKTKRFIPYHYREVLTTAFKADLNETLDWYGEASAPEQRALSSALRDAVANELARNPRAFLEKLESRNRLDAFTPVFEGLSSHTDFASQWQEVAGWLKEQPDGLAQQALSATLATTLATKNPPAAIEFVDQIADPDSQTKLREEVATKLIENPSLETLAFYRARYPEWSRVFTLASFEKLGGISNGQRREQFPVEMDSWVSAASALTGDDLAQVAPNLTKALFHRDPDSALQWIQSVPEGRLAKETKIEVFETSFGSWIWENEAQALQWIAQDELGSFHEQSTRIAVGRLSDRGAPLPEVWPWFAALAEPDSRKSAFRSLKRSYGTTDQKELTKRIEALPLPAVERSHYLEQLTEPKR